jgi:hypothetical protein
MKPSCGPYRAHQADPGASILRCPLQHRGIAPQIARRLLIFPLLLSLSACTAPAQEALRNSLAGEAAATQLRRQLENAPYSARWGDLKLLIEPSLSMDWNDNVLYSDLRKQEDFILRPLLNLTSLYPIGQRNALKFSAGIGYEQYFRHDAYSRFLVQPGSEVSLDVFVKDLRLNVHERFSYEQDPGRLGEVSGVAEFGGIYNTAGASATWDLQNVVLNAGYDYFRFISSSARFDYLDRGSHQLVARGGLKVHPTAVVGLEVAGGPTQYDQPRLNDNTGLSVGAYAQWQATEHITVQPRAGYALYTFSRNSFFGKPDDLNAFYFDVQVEHRVNPRISYTVEGGHQIQPSVYANLLDLWTASLQANWGVIKDVSLFTRLSYENGKQIAWFYGEKYDRVGASLGLGYRLMDKLTSRLAYNLLIKDSNVAPDDYTQNRITLGLTYRF